MFSISSSCHYQIRNTTCIGIDCEKIVHVSVKLRLDYANVLMYRLPAKTTILLTWLIMRSGYRDHMTHVLHKLHLLPFELRVDYNVLMYTDKAIHNIALLI